MWQIWLNWQRNKLSDCGIAVTFYDWQQVGPPQLQFRDPCCRCLVLAILLAAGNKLQWHDLQATTGRVTMDKEKSLSQVKATAFEKPSKYCTRMSNECNVWFFRLDSENVITCTHTQCRHCVCLQRVNEDDETFVAGLSFIWSLLHPSRLVPLLGGQRSHSTVGSVPQTSVSGRVSGFTWQHGTGWETEQVARMCALILCMLKNCNGGWIQTYSGFVWFDICKTEPSFKANLKPCAFSCCML